ncbi:MAG: sensor histidine kinase [Lachnospiraceae bacterium]|nr:sensor histidine kinase [Lachnospiraceae bacterium]
MDSNNKTDLEIICAANKEMLDYFNSRFLEKLEDIQELKTQSFEIDVKIEELEKTKDIYAFKSNSRKSIFTPNTNDDSDNVRGQIIDQQIEELRQIQEGLGTKLRSKEIKLNALKRRLNSLNQAQDALKRVSPEALNSSYSEDEEGFEFIETDTSNRSHISHGHSILMQDAFDKAYLTTLIDRNIKNNLLGLTNKLELLTYLLGTDISRAKLTLKEIISSSKDIAASVDDIAARLNKSIDSGKPLWSQVDEFIMLRREQYPEYLIEADVDCSDYELNVHPVFIINTLVLLDIFFDNIFKHSNANNIVFKLSITPNLIECEISDNGIGISDNYLNTSPWYSSLHKAHEIIYLLGGNIRINGDITTGTYVRFDFPIQFNS